MPESVLEPIQAAIQATLTAIQNRARLYRNLVVSVTVVVIGSVILAVIFRSVIPLLGLLLLVPLAGTYFVLDTRCTRLWSKHILGMWVEGELNLTAFSGAISAHQYVPRGTLEGMLGWLPKNEGRIGIAHENKLEIASRLEAAARRQQVLTSIAAAGLVAGPMLLIMSIISGSRLLFLLSLASAAMWAIARWKHA